MNASAKPPTAVVVFIVVLACLQAPHASVDRRGLGLREERPLLAALRTKLDLAAKDGTFSGAVMIARGGAIVFSAAHGLANRERGRPNTLDTRFRMGSMNKMFTATAVLQLVQAGKVSLHAPIGRYLEDYPNRAVATTVTVHHLLTHTGGTGNIFGPEFAARRLELRTIADYVALYGARAPAFEPGSRYEYSNYGFVLLGALVARVSGQDYYDYVHDHVFKPAGMTATGSEPEDRVVPGRSTGYMERDGRLVANTDTLPYRGSPAGGGYTTVGDLVRFANALANHVLLDAPHTALLTTGKVDSREGRRYGYGFEVSGEGDARTFGHSGGAPGMNGELRIFPGSGYVVASLANIDAAASRVVAWVSDRLPRSKH